MISQKRYSSWQDFNWLVPSRVASANCDRWASG